MTVANNTAHARQHHKQHGDMDGYTCLLSRCALHYPDSGTHQLHEIYIQGCRECYDERRRNYR